VKTQQNDQSVSHAVTYDSVKYFQPCDIFTVAKGRNLISIHDEVY